MMLWSLIFIPFLSASFLILSLAFTLNPNITPDKWNNCQVMTTGDESLNSWSEILQHRVHFIPASLLRGGPFASPTRAHGLLQTSYQNKWPKKAHRRSLKTELEVSKHKITHTVHVKDTDLSFLGWKTNLAVQIKLCAGLVNSKWFLPTCGLWQVQWPHPLQQVRITGYKQQQLTQS